MNKSVSILSLVTKLSEFVRDNASLGALRRIKKV